MRGLVASIAAAALAVCALACGGAQQRTASHEAPASAAPASKSANTVPAVSAEAAAIIHAHAGFEWRYRNDGDRENPRDADKDHPEDDDTDSRFHENARYLDADDTGVVTFGHPAAAAEAVKVRAMVKRYYALAASADGAAACGQLAPHLAKAAPIDYGQEGPSYLRGAKTCGEVLTRMFRHSRFDYSAPYDVTDVRVDGDEGIAVLGSTRARPSSIALEREKGAWGVGQLLPQPMP